MEQVPRKAVDRVDRLAAGAGHLGDGVEDLVDQGVGVNFPDRLSGQAYRRRRRSRRCRIGLQPVGTNRCRRRRRRFRARLVEERFLTLGGVFRHRDLAKQGRKLQAPPLPLRQWSDV